MSVLALLTVLAVATVLLVRQLDKRRYPHEYDQLGRVCVCDRCMAERFEVTP